MRQVGACRIIVNIIILGIILVYSRSFYIYKYALDGYIDSINLEKEVIEETYENFDRELFKTWIDKKWENDELRIGAAIHFINCSYWMLGMLLLHKISYFIREASRKMAKKNK